MPDPPSIIRFLQSVNPPMARRLTDERLSGAHHIAALNNQAAETGRLLTALKELIVYEADNDWWFIEPISMAFIENPQTREAVKAFLKEAEDA